MNLFDDKSEFKWLRRISLRFISAKDFDRIEKTSVRLVFKKGETVLKQGGLSTHVAYLEKGIVKFNFKYCIST
jgi:CRP-like cAMP-binding protein